MPKYPAQIDTTQSLPTAVDNLTPVQGAIFNKLRDAVISIQSELGVKPSATYTTVKARVDVVENAVGNLQVIQLNQDLGNTLNNPYVIGIQGRPVSSIAPLLNEVLSWNGVAWAPGTPSGSTGPAGPPGPTGPTGPSGVGGTLIGDANGPIVSNTVNKINGAPVSTIGAANTVLVTTDGVNVSYHQIANAQVALSAAINKSKLENSSGLSVAGRSANSSGVLADITGTNNQVLRISGSVLGFGAIDLSTAQVTGVLPTGNQAAQTMAGDVTGVTSSSVVSKINGTSVITAGGSLSSGQVLRAITETTADWGPLDLSNPDAVTGVLSIGYQEAQTLNGDVNGTTGENSVDRIKGAALDNSVGSVGPAQDGYSLVYVNSSASWKPVLISGGSGGTLSGDVTGSSSANTVIKINGSPVTTIGSSNTVLGTTNGTSITYFQIANAQVSSSAAIAYSKLALSNSIVDSDVNTSAAIAVSKLANSTALSVLGRSANSTGVHADIAGANNQALRISGSVLGFGTLDLSTALFTGILPTGNQASQSMGGDVTGTTAAATVAKINGSSVTTIGSANTVLGTTNGTSITYFQVADAQVSSSAAIAVSKLANSTALSVLGRSANSIGAHADVAGTDNQVLRISGSVLGFGAVDLSTVQVTGVLPTGNQASQTMGGDVSGTTASNTVVNINGSPVSTIGPANTVLGTTNGTSITYFQVANAQVSSSAGIVYSKLSLSNSILDADINTAAAVAVSKLANSTALSVLGRSANSTGAHADIAGANNQVLRVSGSVLGFGAVDLSTAQVTGILPAGNQAAQTMAGDVTGTTAASTVVNINGSPVSTIGSANTVLGTTDGTNISYFQVANAQVSSSAAIAMSKLANSTALAVLGRSANSTGIHADISTTAASDAVLRESGSVLGFGTVATGGITNNAITDAKLRQSGALSVVGRSANSTGNVADIAGTNNQVLIISGSVLGFGAVDLSTPQVTGVLPTANQAAQTTGGDISGTTASSTVDKLKGTALAASVGTVGATQDGYSLVWDNGTSTWKPTLISSGSGGTLSGDVTGPEGSNTVVKIRGVSLASSVGTVGATQDGYSLVYVNSHAAWEPVLISTGGGNSLGGDVTGPQGANTVVNINGSPVSTIGSANTVLGTTNGTSITYFQVANAQVSSSAAIAYSKLALSNSILDADINTSAAIAVSKLANSTATSVLGRSANSTGAHADIAGSNNQVLRVSGSVLGFGAVDLSTAQVTGTLPAGNQATQTMAGDVTGTTAASTVVNINGSPVTTIGTSNTVLGTTDGSSITYFQVADAQVSSSAAIAVSKLANSTALAVLGRSANSTGAHADIAGTNNQVLRISGSVLGFGAVDLSTAQVTGVLPTGNQASQSMGGDVSGTTAASVVDKLKGTALAASVGTVGAAQDGYALTWDNGTSTWKPTSTGGSSSLGGDVTGPIGTNTVVKINGSSVTTIGAANTVLGTTDGSSITYFQVADAQVGSSAAIAVSKLANSTALSVLGRSANSTGTHADIAGTNNQVLRVSGSVLGFGSIDLSTPQITGTLPSGNQAAQTMGGDVSGTTAASVVDKLKGTALAASVGTVGAAQDGYALTWDNGSSTWKPSSVSSGGTLSGDVSGSASANTVDKIKGTALAASVGTVGAGQNGYALAWNNGTSSWTPTPMGGGGGGVGVGSVIYKVGATTAAPIYGTFLEAYNVVVGIPGAVIIIDDNGTGGTMDSGTYDLTGLTLRGKNDFTILNIPATGVTITGLPSQLDFILWRSSATSPVCTLTSGYTPIVLTNTSALQMNPGGTDFIAINPTANVSVYLQDYSEISNFNATAGSEVIKVNDNTTDGYCSIFLDNGASVTDNSVIATTSTHISFFYPTAATTVIYKGGMTNANARTYQVYSTFSAAYSAIVGVPGGVIIIDETLSTGSCTMDLNTDIGPYNLTGLTLRGSTVANQTSTVLNIDDGVTISRMPTQIDFLNWISNSNSVVFTANSPSSYLKLTHQSSLQVGTGTDFIHAGTFQFINIHLESNSSIGNFNWSATGNEVVKVTTDGGVQIYIGEMCTVYDWSIIAPGSGTYISLFCISPTAATPFVDGNKVKIIQMLTNVIAFGNLSLSSGVSNPQYIYDGAFSESTSITVSLKMRDAGATNTVMYAALGATGGDRVYQTTPGSGGSFIVRAIKSDGSTNTADNSIVDAMVILGISF
jgi:collagen type VII alpha